MARPRVFVSSTFYDLRQIRTELEGFIRNMGYEPVLAERGHISYGKDGKPEQSCYREIANCDIVISIVGSRFGSVSQDGPYSISQKELKTALDDNKQVYIFIDKAVHAEHKTYLANKDIDIKYGHADDPQIHKFIEEMHNLPNNNAVFPFESAQDILAILREQWAGLFKDLLAQHAQLPVRNALSEVRATAASLQQLIDYLVAEQKNTDVAVESILLMNHPLFARLETLLKTGYRVFFVSKTEMDKWLLARGFQDTTSVFAEEPDPFEYESSNTSGKTELTVSCSLFDENGKLRPIRPDDWDDSMVSTRIISYMNEELDDPFAEE